MDVDVLCECGCAAVVVRVNECTSGVWVTTVWLFFIILLGTLFVTRVPPALSTQCSKPYSSREHAEVGSLQVRCSFVSSSRLDRRCSTILV